MLGRPCKAPARPPEPVLGLLGLGFASVFVALTTFAGVFSLFKGTASWSLNPSVKSISRFRVCGPPPAGFRLAAANAVFAL